MPRAVLQSPQDEDIPSGKKGGHMDIAGLSTALSQINTSSDIGVVMLSKALDTQEKLGDDMIKMMEQSVNPNLGANVDVRV